MTLILLAICVSLAIVAAGLGVDDNPPGILLAYLAAIAFILTFVHRWRTAWPFGLLLFASVVGVALFIFLDIFFATFAHSSETTDTFQNLSKGFDAAFFLGALIIPAAFVVGVVGLVVVFIRKRR